MSGYRYDHEESSIRSGLSGAYRPSANPRLHTVAKPYSRPSSYSGPSSQPILNGNGGLGGSPTKAITKSTRPPPTSNSSGSLTRSGSDSSLFSGLKSIFSRPLQWLAAPSRAIVTPGGTKRDSYSSFGQDVEDPESPNDRHEGKRIRRTSPRLGGDYAPTAFEVEGRAVSGYMLPALPPHLSLAPRAQGIDKPLPNRTNFSRPLNMPTSKSMPYLDPPTNLLGSSRRRGMGSMSRSRRMDMTGFGDEDDDMGGVKTMSKGKGKEMETHDDKNRDMEDGWSPRKNRSAFVKQSTTSNRATPSRNFEPRDYTLPSLSPFKIPPSPSSARHPTPNPALGRSNTTLNLQRAASVASDVSMARESVRRPRQSSSIGFGSFNGDRDKGDERMSVDGDREREGSVLDWFMRDRWSSREPGSPASRAASMRLGSAGPSSGMPPIRKGQLVWDAEKGFVRESELKAAEAFKPVHQNDAERILFALESIRKTPLTDARKSSSFNNNPLPPELIGSSSRQLRKAISVPLATAQAGENAKNQRNRERLGENHVSVMISPYGRRREMDQATNDARRNKQRQDGGSDYRPTRSPSQHESRHSRHSSQASDQDMRSDREATPSPAPTPRRSSRLKRHDAADEEVTPKAKKTRGKGSASVKKAAVETTTPKDMPRRTRRGTMEQATSPDPPPSAPPGPTITETAPSPGEQTSRSSTYQPRAEGDLPRGSSSLRAKTEMTKRAHTGAASYNSSRAGSPSTTGRYSAREEDLPPMEDLEHAKIPLPSFSAISFGHLDTTPTPALDSEATSNSSGTSLLDRIGPSPSQSNQQAVSLAVPSSSRLSGGPLTHRNGGSSTRPRASSPLASGSIVPESELPPISDKPPTAAQTAPQPPLDGFFRLTPSAHANTPATEPGSTLFAGFGDSATVGPKKTLGSGMGKPSASPAPEQKNTTSSDVPDFFGTKSNPTSGTSTPVPPPSPFNFGFGPKPVEGASSFSFGSKPPKATPAVVQTNGLTSDSGGALQPNEKSSPAPVSFLTTTKPAEPVAPATPLFSFGTAKPTEVPKPAFSFGSQSSIPATDKPVEAPEPSFSFGTSSSATPAASKPSRESAKPTDGFGGSASTPPVSKPAEDAPKPTFSFAAPTASTSPTPAAEPAATFGGFNFSKPAEPAKDITARANGTTPSFGFGQANGTSGFGSGKQVNGTGEAAKSNPFAGGGSSSAAPDVANSAFGFGSSQTPRANGTSAPASSFDAPATSTPSTSFGFGSSSPAVASNPFASSSNFQQGAPAIQAPPFSFNANNTPAAPATSNLFASSQSQQPVTSGGFGFNFKANTNQSPSTPQAAPSFGFGQSNPVPSTPSATSSGFGFGTPAATTAQPSFSFGTTTPQATPPSFGFGAPAAAPRFGSPVPGGAPADGGFSLGMGPDAQAPGSPSGRKIKPLRRGAIKR